MNRYLYAEEKDNRRAGIWLSILFHIILLFLFLAPCFSYFKNNPPEQPQGIMVALGVPDSDAQTEVRNTPKAEPKEKTPPSESKPVRDKVVEIEKTSPKLESETLEEKSTVVADKRANEEAKKLAAVAKEKEAARERAAELERQRLEEENRKKEEKKKAKSKFSSLLNSGSDEAHASAGSELGKPDATILDQLTRGTGTVGDGLGARKLLYAPEIRDNSQKTGRVIVNICVNAQGQVVSSRFRQKGSTTTDAYLVRLAEQNVSKYRFSESNTQEQCGDIVIDFKLK